MGLSQERWPSCLSHSHWQPRAAFTLGGEWEERSKDQVVWLWFIEVGSGSQLWTFFPLFSSNDQKTTPYLWIPVQIDQEFSSTLAQPAGMMETSIGIKLPLLCRGLRCGEVHGSPRATQLLCARARTGSPVPCPGSCPLVTSVKSVTFAFLSAAAGFPWSIPLLIRAAMEWGTNKGGKK